MQDNILFYLAFASQLLLVSYYLPSKIVARMRHVTTHYPPAKYPKLYPQSIDCYEKGQQRFIRLNYFVLAVGVLLLVADIVWTSLYGGGIADVFPVIFGLAQFMPMMKLELSEAGQFRLMRKANVSTKRTAGLSRRRLFDHVSPALVFAVVLMVCLSIVMDFYWHDFTFELGHDTFVRTVTLIVCNGLFAFIIGWNLYGKKQNPHQSWEDRSKQIEMVCRSFMLMSIVMSVFFASVAAGDVYDMEAYEPVVMSLYFQIIALISIGSIVWGQPLEELNFDVYKA